MCIVYMKSMSVVSFSFGFLGSFAYNSFASFGILIRQRVAKCSGGFVMADDKKSKKELKAEETTVDGKTKALSLAMETIEKQFGKGAIMKLGTAKQVPVKTMPTGSI